MLVYNKSRCRAEHVLVPKRNRAPSHPEGKEGVEWPSPSLANKWQKIVGRYAKPNNWAAANELVITLLLAALSLVVAVLAGKQHWALGILWTPMVAMTLVRLFVIQHDCGHGSFFASRKANDWVGRALSLFTLFPYSQWRYSHARHHASVGKLSERGVGDIKTITILEYERLSASRKLIYRTYRHPFFLFVTGGAYYAFVRNRFRRKGTGWLSSQSLNIFLGVGLLGISHYGFLREFLQVWIPSVSLAASVGVAFFYTGHQFKNSYWATEPEWQLAQAALAGSSFLVLPRLLDWFTGYIGHHHVHHLNSRVPLYRLSQCVHDHPELTRHNRLTIREAVRSTRLSLWDERAACLVRTPLETAHEMDAASRYR